jgi:hypothetical protein
MLSRFDRKVSRAVALALVACISCRGIVDPQLPPDAQRFVPPSVYARWWAMVEACSGIDRPLADVEWYAAPGPLRNPNGTGEFVQGYWSPASNRIVLVSNDTIAGGIVRHEMLHAVVRVTGHPRSEFLQKCGGVVTCSAPCVRDAGPPTPPTPGTPTVAPSQLEVTSAVSPATPGSSIDGGLFTFTISVRNPYSQSVVALLPVVAAGGTPVSYPYDIRSVGGDGVVAVDLAVDVGVTYFSAGETKRHVFDFLVAPSGFTRFYGFPGVGEAGIAFSPATYTFRGGYGDHMAADVDVVLNP